VTEQLYKMTESAVGIDERVKPKQNYNAASHEKPINYLQPNSCQN